MEKYSKAVSEMYSQFGQGEAHPMEKYSKAVSEMYSQFGQGEAHPMEKYVGRHVFYLGNTLEVVGYRCDKDNHRMLIAEAPKGEGWTVIGPHDVISKACGYYWYVTVGSLIG